MSACGSGTRSSTAWDGQRRSAVDRARARELAWLAHAAFTVGGARSAAALAQADAWLAEHADPRR